MSLVTIHKPVEVSIADLKPCKYNPRIMSKTEEAGLRSSLERFGLVETIVVNKRNMSITGGNQRLRILKSMGVEKVPVIYVDLNDIQEKFLNLALNNRGITGEYTKDVLSIIEELMNEDIEAYDDLRLFEIEKDVDYKKDDEDEEGLDVSDSSDEAEVNEAKAALDLYEHYDYIVIATRDYRDFQWLVSFFDIKQEMDRISQKIGIGRGIKAVDAIAKIQAAIENGKKDVTSSD